MTWSHDIIFITQAHDNNAEHPFLLRFIHQQPHRGTVEQRHTVY